MKPGNIEQMLREFSDGTYDLTYNGECTQCGSCCSNLLPMTDSEIRKIRKYIKDNGIKQRRHIIPTVSTSVDMNCPFLNTDKKNGKCEIYSVRPRVCRDFICCPSKRPPVDFAYCSNCRVIDVRKEFYGEI